MTRSALSEINPSHMHYCESAAAASLGLVLKSEVTRVETRREILMALSAISSLTSSFFNTII